MNTVELTAAAKSSGAAAPGRLQRSDGKKRALQVASPGSALVPLAPDLLPSPHGRNRRCSSKLASAAALGIFTTLRFNVAEIIMALVGDWEPANCRIARARFPAPDSPRDPATRVEAPRLLVGANSKREVSALGTRLTRGKEIGREHA